MFQSHPDSNTLWLDFNLCFSQISVNVSCRVTCGENDGAKVFVRGVRDVFCFDANHTHVICICRYSRSSFLNPPSSFLIPPSSKNQPRHLRLKMNFATTIDDRVAHRLNDLWQTVCADMGMGICQDSRRGTMLAEHIQNLVRITSLFTAGIEFAVRIGTCPTLTKAVVALCIYFLRLGDVGQIFLTVMHILASFQNYWAQSEFYQTQGSEETSRTGTHDNHLRLPFHIGIFSSDKFIVVRLFIHIHPHLQVHIYLSLTRVDTPFKNPDTIDGSHVNTLLISQIGLQSILLCSHFGHNPYLIFICHLFNYFCKGTKKNREK